MKKRGYVLTSVLALLSACGGGGGGSDSTGSGASSSISSTNPTPPPGLVFSIDKNSLKFVAGRPSMPVPPAQNIIGTVTGTVAGTLYVFITISGNAVTTAPAVSLSGATGTASIRVQSPALLGEGTYTSNLQVRACLNDSTCRTGELTGSPQNVEVTYVIGSAIPKDAVAPRVVASNTSGKFVLRGKDVGSASTVNLGGTQVVFSVVSSTELLVSYPTLAASTYPIMINGGAISFSGSLVVADVPSYSATTLTLPSTPTRLVRIVYDAERNTLLLGAIASSGGQIWRYSYNSGSWGAPSITSVPGLKDFTISLDHSRLLVVTDYSILELNPSSLLTQHVVPAPFTSADSRHLHLQHIALANDGTAVMSTHVDSPGNSSLFYYFTAIEGFTEISSLQQYAHPSGWYPMLVANDWGSRIFATDNGLSTPPPILHYQTSTGVLALTGAAFSQSNGQPLAVDSSASRIAVFNGINQLRIMDSNYAQLGAITGAEITTVILNPAGTRAYVLFQDNMLRSYDVTAASGGSFTEVSAPISVTSPVYSVYFEGAKSTITPDGKTLFIAGNRGIVVQPAPQ